MRLRTALAVLVVLAAPRPGLAGCSVVEGDHDNSGTTDVRLLGDTARQSAVIEIHGDGSYLVSLDCNHDGDYADAGDAVKSGPGPIESFYVELGGNDDVAVVQTGNIDGVSKDIVVIETTGVNAITYDTQGFGILNNSNLGIEIIGGSRFEKVTLDFSGSTISNSVVNVRGDLGSDGDRVDVLSALATTGSDVDIDLDMGPGANRVTFDDEGGVI